MSKEKEILRLHYEGESQRDICAALQVGHTRVNRLIASVREKGLCWEAAGGMDDSDIQHLLLPGPAKESPYALPDFKRLAKELERPGVTRKLLWHQYCSNITGKMTAPYQYAQFCKLFDEYLATTKAVMRLTHEPGKRGFVDWAGQSATVWDDITAAAHTAYLFVACLPYSAYMFVHAFPSMGQGCWTEGHILAFGFFGGVPSIIVPDNCATATDRPPACTIKINGTYRDLAAHYSSAVLPARVRKSNDKALVEASVLIAERQILAPLRDERFFSFADLNEAIAARVAVINGGPFQKRPGSRLSVFLEEEWACLKPLPPTRFEIAEYKTAKTGIDYHLQIDSQRYSVPFSLIGKRLEARLTGREVRIFNGTEEVACHARLHGRKGQYSTVRSHMPPNHQNYDDDWSPGRFLRWAGGIGPATRWAIGYILDSRAAVEQAYAPCINILGLAKRGKKELLEEACAQIKARKGIPAYSPVKNTMAAIRATRDLERKGGAGVSRAGRQDSLGEAGMTRGACYYALGDDE